jgi:hypothetical protein
MHRRWPAFGLCRRARRPSRVVVQQRNARALRHGVANLGGGRDAMDQRRHRRHDPAIHPIGKHRQRAHCGEGSEAGLVPLRSAELQHLAADAQRLDPIGFREPSANEWSWRRSKRRLRSEWRAARSRTRRTGRANYAHSGRARAGVPIASPRKATRVRRDVAQRRTSAGLFAASMALMCMCMRPSVCCCLWLAPINVWRVRPSPSGICNDHPDEYRRPRIVRDAGGGA